MKRTSSNQKKYDKLGIPFGTANGRLKKNIMFDLVCKLRLNLCFHCKLEITNVDQFSIEHKIPWLNSDNPKELFYDLNNIAFSHLFCNIDAGEKITPLYNSEQEKTKEYYDRMKADPIKYRKKLDDKIKYYHKNKGR